MTMTDEQLAAAEEFRHAATEFIRNPCAGTFYALEMAAEECMILGIEPSQITPNGYVSPEQG